MPATPLVCRTEHGAARARGRDQERHAAARGAKAGTVASYEIGDLPRTRPALAFGQEIRADSIRAQIAPRTRASFPWICDSAFDYRGRPGKILRTDLR